MKKLGTKPIIAIMVLIVVVIGVILVLLTNAAKSFSDDLISRQSKSANAAFVHALDIYQDQALERAEMIAGSGDVISAIENGDNEKLLKELNNLSVGLDLITLCDADGNVLARTHSDKTGDSVITQKAISTALQTGRGIKTIEPGTVIGLSTRGSAAIKDASGKIIGALTCGHDLSQQKYVDDIKAQNNCEVTFFAGDTRMSSTLRDEKGNSIVGTKTDDKVAQDVLSQKTDFSGRKDLYGYTYAAYYSPLIVDNQAVGMLFTGINIEDALKQEQSMLIMIIIAAVMLLVAFLVVAFLMKTSTKKAHWYESMLDSIPFPVSVTDMDMNWTFINKPVEDMLGIKRRDALGKHCSSWGAGICNTNNCGINCLKNGMSLTHFNQLGMEFQVNINYLYDARGKKEGHIEIVQDITKTVEGQKAQTALVEKIRNVSGTFVDASRQISEGAQSLAQGSTEQASAVEELSSSISEIAQKTKGNAEMADQAAKLADTIMDNARKGSEQMDQMTQAVHDINEASQSISKVISVIDNIAFQTNILALNAAVEAARAGQHGKGFAVVAEEVRALASKSAEAASDTSSLIANSMEKAELGARIAGETALSLADIVSGINESGKLVTKIAQASDEQSRAITEINKGIDQVAQVVQQNSATAQQSAAASQQLNGQSAVLEELLGTYHAENLTDANNKELPPKRPDSDPVLNAKKY